VKRIICRLRGHVPVTTIRPGHLLLPDWTFGREQLVAEESCSRCGKWLSTRAVQTMEEHEAARDRFYGFEELKP